MRLLHTKDYTFKEFIGSNIPPYAIISHRWSDEEVSYQDFLEQRDSFLNGHCWEYGWKKISQACETAAREEIRWVWIDTCCIDKKSSAELSEAINSMFAWYRDSLVCYVFLADVHQQIKAMRPRVAVDHEPRDPSASHSSITAELFQSEEFSSSGWFTRAWTLQELIAPRNVIFFNSDFVSIGTRRELATLISNATGIPRAYLWLQAEERPSVGARMKWASKRQATRAEDLAYSLLGLFDVNMPLLYGEGAKAFQRLQLEVFRQSDDESIFDWQAPTQTCLSLLAPSLDCFAKTEDHRSRPMFLRQHSEVTNRGIKMVLHLPTDYLMSVLQTPTLTVLIPLNLIEIHLSPDGRPWYEIPCLEVGLVIQRSSHVSEDAGEWRAAQAKYFTGFRRRALVVNVGRSGWEEFLSNAEKSKAADRHGWGAIAHDAPGCEAVTVYFPLMGSSFPQTTEDLIRRKR